MKINKLATQGTGDVSSGLYTSQAFIYEIEANLTWLYATQDRQLLNVTPQKAMMYKGDFLGLLNAEGLAPNAWWAATRLNDYFSPSDFDGTKVDFIMPSDESIKTLARRFLTTYKIAI